MKLNRRGFFVSLTGLACANALPLPPKASPAAKVSLPGMAPRPVVHLSLINSGDWALPRRSMAREA